MTAASPDSHGQMPFQDLIRTANEQDMLRGDWPAWRRYRDMRTRTSHAYAATVAAQVVAGIPDFLAEAKYLVDRSCDSACNDWPRFPQICGKTMPTSWRGAFRAYTCRKARVPTCSWIARPRRKLRRYSDLDLALEWDQPLGLDVIGEIAEALSESDLPYKVDIVDLLTVDPAFRARIAADCMAFDTIEAGG